MAVLNVRTDGVPKGAVPIWRPTKWGNRFVIGRDGDRAAVIEKHRRALWNDIRAGRVTLEELAALHGRDLVCHCAPLPCHGDTLARAAAWAYQQINGEMNADR